MTDLHAEIESLHTLSVRDLAERYESLHGQPCRTRHRAYLIRKIAWRLQANAEGGLSERARRRARELANDADVRVMAPKTLVCPPPPDDAKPVTVAAPATHAADDPRLPPPGSAIVRAYKGRRLRVLVLPDSEGFELDGQRFRTLSAVAKHVTGSHLNGYRFFRLDKKVAR